MLQVETSKKTFIEFSEPTECKIWFASDEQEELVLAVEQLKKSAGQSPRFTFCETPDEADVILIHTNTDAWGWEAVKAIRTKPEHFLKTCLLLTQKHLAATADIVDQVLYWPLSPAVFFEALGKVAQFNEKLARLAEIPNSIGMLGLRKVLLLRYLYTRDPCVLLARRNFQSAAGYTYPLMQLLFNVEAGQEFNIIQSLEESQLLTSKLIDRVHICPFCEHAQINFRELCPNCNALNIGEETTIHHFRCAYVGKESEFKQDLELSCPKCSRTLEHIGVDYDKPAEVLWCNDCKHNFADPKLSCFCLACGKSFDPEDAFVRQIGDLTLTLEGFRAAEDGLLPGHGVISILKKELGFYKKEVFVEYLNLEASRCQRYKYHSTLARLNLKPLDEALGHKDIKNSRRLRNELSTIVNQTFRTTDLFTDLSSGEILIIFTNTDCGRTKVAFERLGESLSKLLNTRLNIEFKLLDLAREDTDLAKFWESLR